MRPASDLPRQRSPRRISRRGAIVGSLVLLIALVLFSRALAQFYLDALWHDALGRSDVFWGQLRAKLTMFAIFFVAFLLLAGINLYFADRAAPQQFPANVHPYVERFHEMFGQRLRFIRYATAAVLAFILALPAASNWQDWLLFRNSVSFGVRDPQFHVDVGFYVFELPFLSFAIDWLFAALIIVLLLTLAAHLLNGGVLFTSSMPTVRPATRVHIAVLLALLAAVKAGDYWLTRYALTNETRGFVQGATYTVVNAQIPALMLLMLIALLTAGLFLWTIRSNHWRLPIVASALWLVIALVGGLIYPAVVQWAVVRPNQAEREATYIARNVEATRQALGLDKVIVQPVQFSRLSTKDVAGDLEPIKDVRLLNPVQMLSRFTFDRGEKTGLVIADLDVDRYVLDSKKPEQVLIAARELDIGSIPNKSWQGKHLASTRGCGLVMAPASRVTTQDRPQYRDVALNRPELYFSPETTTYAVARTDVAENPCGSGAPYSGTSGVKISGLRRAAFALAFLDYNLLGSGAINSDSQMLWRRSVEDRVKTLAPFLHFDGDPYPVVVNGGVQWVIDAYTSTSRYPYAQRIGNIQLSDQTGLPRDSNYVRNSVKAVVDAYTGDVTFYVVDEADPIVRAWQSAFPHLFTAIDKMPAELRQHLRYPEDLFRVQTELYSKYQVDASEFFSRNGAWSVAQAPSTDRQESNPTTPTPTGADQQQANGEFATESNAARFTPYYTMFRSGLTGKEEFVILRPFVPFSTNDRRTELQAYLTASSDPDTYGTLVSYVVQQDPLPPGPLRVADQAESEQTISPQLSLQANQETQTRVVFGDLQLVPVSTGLLYIRPVYVFSSDVPEFRFVIVSTGSNAALGTDLESALSQLFPGFQAALGDRVPDAGDATTSPTNGGSGSETSGEASSSDQTSGEQTGSNQSSGDNGSTTGEPTPLSLLDDAQELFSQADDLLKAGDLGGYQKTITEAKAKVAEAIDALDSSANS
jgi:uncharacterized membrane protein (UPF0182 family)